MVFPNDFESVLRIDWRKMRKMRRDMVAAAFGRRHHVPSHFSYFSAVNSENRFKIIGQTYILTICIFWGKLRFLENAKFDRK